MSRILILVLSCLVANAAGAHADVSESTPAAGTELDSSPPEVVLIFTDKVRLTALTVSGPGRDGPDRLLGPLPDSFGRGFAAPLSALPAGHYTIRWRALSTDMHVMRGEIPFAIRGD